ncbi:DUF3822 family protein [Flavobacterium sp.]|uniref:DUF3822 family protein n=1 Tax=Flavobacterium sp. TaxID=239 RepID=UPI002611B8B5|nr:DUF3822 family protein [Flavobacterium sp.]MDD2986595.1 DUF3822 family protein [Flavobacterium sp.]
MEITNSNIIQKSYKKLSIQVSLNGLSFCCRDTLSGQLIAFDTIDFSVFPKNFTLENSLWKALLDFPDLTKSYDEIILLHENSLNALVPKPLFDEEYKGSYLQYNTKVFETDFFAVDEVDKYEMMNVYVPYVHINNYLLDQFGSFEYKHYSSYLISKLLDLSKNDEAQNMFVHVADTHFEISVIQNQKLILFNSFDYQTSEDFLYYLLFTAEQLHLNPESMKLFFLGKCEESDELFKKAYQYIRNTSLLDVSDLQKTNSYSARENRTNFILFNT